MRGDGDYLTVYSHCHYHLFGNKICLPQLTILQTDENELIRQTFCQVYVHIYGKEVCISADEWEI